MIKGSSVFLVCKGGAPLPVPHELEAVAVEDLRDRRPRLRRAEGRVLQHRPREEHRVEVAGAPEEHLRGSFDTKIILLNSKCC